MTLVKKIMLCTPVNLTSTVKFLYGMLHFPSMPTEINPHLLVKFAHLYTNDMTFYVPSVDMYITSLTITNDMTHIQLDKH